MMIMGRCIPSISRWVQNKNFILIIILMFDYNYAVIVNFVSRNYFMKMSFRDETQFLL